jgi:mRNA interferase YafQ
MQEIEYSASFKRDYRKVKASPRHSRDIDSRLAGIVPLLCDDRPLPASNRDHPLAGEWNGHRECHVKADLLLIYRKPDKETLHLVRLGSHSDLF